MATKPQVPDGFVPDGFEPDSSTVVPGMPMPSDATKARGDQFVQGGALKAARAALPWVGMGIGGAMQPEFIPAMFAAGAGGVLGGGVSDALGVLQGDPEKGNAEQLSDAAIRFLQGATGEGVGRGVAAGASKVGQGLSELAFRPTPTLKKDFSKTVMGDAPYSGKASEQASIGQIATSGEARAPVGAFRGQVISDRIADGVKASGQRLRDLLKRPKFQQAKFTTLDFAPELRRLYNKAAADPASDAASKTIGEALDVFDRKYGGKSLTYTEVLDIKQRADAAAAAAHRAAATGKNTIADAGLVDFYKAQADAARRILNAASPEVRAINNETQRLLFMERAAIDAEARGAGVMRQLWVPALTASAAGGSTYAGTHDPARALTAAALMGSLSDPRMSSRLALLLTDPAFAAAARRAPQAIGGLMDASGAGGVW